ncbi:MAG: hypothetical protein S4CHLAM102_10520 [Chlamydiia bacterium]|nr:hypothetical protein [Chlamydiia bacterium]
MSRHPSYGKSRSTAAKRTVMTRAERIAIRKSNGVEVKKGTGHPKQKMKS